MEFYAGKQVDIFAIGKKGNDVLSKGNTVIANESAVYDDLTFDNVAAIADTLTEKFVTGEYDKIELIYNQFKNAFKRLGVEARFANSDKPEDFEALIDDQTKALYLETMGNPGFNIPDFDALASLAKKI